MFKIRDTKEQATANSYHANSLAEKRSMFLLPPALYSSVHPAIPLTVFLYRPPNLYG